MSYARILVVRGTQKSLYLFSSLSVKMVGKLHDGTIFTKKGHDNEPFEFKIDEGNNQCCL